MSDRNRILCEFRNKTKSIMGDSLKQMILYGSYARGDYGDNSDMDIMVLTELTDDRIIQIEDEIFDAAYDIELEYGVPISVNIKNEKHFKNWVNSLPYYSNIQKEGIIIIIHLQISVILFHDFFNTLDSEAMSALICFMGYRKSILIIHRGASAGIYEYDNNKR